MNTDLHFSLILSSLALDRVAKLSQSKMLFVVASLRLTNVCLKPSISTARSFIFVVSNGYHRSHDNRLGVFYAAR